MSNLERIIVSDGTVWEKRVGFSRAVRYGDQIFVSGTTATADDGRLVGPDDPAAQTRFIMQKIDRALQQTGSTIRDIVRYRVYLTNADDWEQVGDELFYWFGDVQPANTLFEISRLVGDGYLVEIEADAIAGSAP